MSDGTSGRRALGLAALAVGYRFRLLHFVRKDDYFAYRWILCAIDRLRSAYQVQVGVCLVAHKVGELVCGERIIGEVTSAVMSGQEAFEDVREGSGPCGRGQIGRAVHHIQTSPALGCM